MTLFPSLEKITDFDVKLGTRIRKSSCIFVVDQIRIDSKLAVAKHVGKLLEIQNFFVKVSIKIYIEQTYYGKAMSFIVLV